MTAHPGSFCAPLGATDQTNAGTPMVCRVGPKGGRARWGRNGPTPKPTTSRRRGGKNTSATKLPVVDAGITLDTPAPAAFIQTGDQPPQPFTPAPAPSDNDIRAAIEAAYRKALADKDDPDASNYVMMRDVRKNLDPNLDRRDVDRVLDKMIEDPDVRLKAELNQAALGDDDRAAAVRIGGQDRDVMCIGEPWPVTPEPSEPARAVTMPPRTDEEIKPPNGEWDRDQGRVHMNSALGRLWEGLGDDRHRQVDGHALGNVIADLGAGISFREHDTNHALAELRRIRDQFPDGSNPAALIDRAIGRLDAPARPAPALPDNAPPQMRTLMQELNAIPLVRRGYDIGSHEGDPYHETDKLADLAQRWSRGELGLMDMRTGINALAAGRHESSEGWIELRAAVAKALQDVNQWGRRPRR